jgi:hypothetical protein
MTLLIFTPTFGDGPRAETLRSVSQQTYTDYVHEVSWHNPYPGEKFANVVAQYQRAWGMALAGGYDGLLTFEHDMTMPANAVQKLLETDAPVVYGVYMLRHGTPTLSAWKYENNINMGMSLSLYPKELKEAKRRGWTEVSGVGWGCTLIRREVLQRLTVRTTGGGDAGDIAFASDCVRAGIKMIARFDVPCGHYDHNGALLEITMNGGIVSRVIALQDVTAGVNGASMPMKKGRYYSIPVNAALELQRVGYVKITNDDDSQQVIGEREQPDIAAREMAINPKVATRKTRKSA